MAFVEGEDAVGIDGLHLAPEIEHAFIAIDAGGRGPEAGRVDEVGHPGGVDRHPGIGEPGRKVPGPPGVIQVDVGHGEGADVVDPQIVERVEQVRERSRWSALDEDPLRGVEEIASEPLGIVVHPGVDQVEIVTQRPHRGVHHGGHTTGLPSTRPGRSSTWAGAFGHTLPIR